MKLLKQVCATSNPSHKFIMIPELLTRVSMGFLFMMAGWGKLTNLAGVTQFFTSIGIPLASVQAPMVAFFEFTCGMMLILGLLTRVAALPLVIIMIVAIMTAKSSELTGISSLFSLSDYLNIILLIWLMVVGSGKLSVDCLICKKKK